MKILIVGSGAREHALCWRVRADRPDAELLCAPGSVGIGAIARLLPIAADDITGLTDWARAQRPDLVVVGPEAPLAAGLVDALRADGVRAFGPTKAAARIETDKAWTANLLQANHVPAPQQAVFADAMAAKTYIKSGDGAVVVKASGLAQGKGALVCDSTEGALAAVDRIMLDHAFGAAGDEIVIQERLVGAELSVFALCDGTDFRILGAARDYKRAYDDDAGLNTGGMGSYTPVAAATPALLAEVAQEVFAPTLGAMQALGCPYTGVLYAGLMLTADGPKVFEFNCRFGDPEAEVILPILRGDFVSALEAATDGRLDAVRLAPGQEAAVCVVVASGGYPESYETGFPIVGLDDVPEDALVFHAGTIERDGKLMTAGGRVIAMVGRGKDLSTARRRAYAATEMVRFDGAFYRTDIAAQEVPVPVPSEPTAMERAAPSPQPSPSGRGRDAAPSPQPSPSGRGRDAAPSPQLPPSGKGRDAAPSLERSSTRQGKESGTA